MLNTGTTPGAQGLSYLLSVAILQNTNVFCCTAAFTPTFADDECCSLCVLLTPCKFLPRELCSAWYMRWLCFCLCVSLTSQCSTEMSKCRMMQTMPHDSPGTLIFWSQKSFRNFNGFTPTWAPNAGGVGQNWQIFTNNLQFLENGTRQMHSYY